MQAKIEQHFIWIILLFSGAALLFPQLFINFKPWLTISLGFIMFGIGMNTPIWTLTATISKPKNLFKLIGIRFLFMPCCAWLIAHIFHLSETASIGLLVLSASPGGTAANIMAYLANANVALTVLLTFGTTLLSPIVTPTLIYIFLHQKIHLDFWPMVIHIANIVMFPILAGLLFNNWKPLRSKINPSLFPIISIFLVAIIIACVFANNQKNILKFPIQIGLAVLCFNVLGFVIGKVVAQYFKQDRTNILATVFDYGMFDAIIAIAICTTFFNQETTLPPVFMSIIQVLTAPIMIYYAKNTPLKFKNTIKKSHQKQKPA